MRVEGNKLDQHDAHDQILPFANLICYFYTRIINHHHLFDNFSICGMILCEVMSVLVRYRPSRLAETGWFFYFYHVD